MSVAKEEWRRHGTLPVAAAIGVAASLVPLYGFGPYIEPISSEFGWSRTQTTFGLTLQAIIGGVCAVPVGIAVDRIGPRLLGIIGVALTLAMFALLATATGNDANWLLLWALLALATLPVQTTVWTAAVAARFKASRGMAFAVTLCGGSLAQIAFPVLAAALITAYGWRSAIVLHAAFCAAFALPILILFFRTAHDPGTARAFTLSGAAIVDELRSPVYARLFAASLFFAFGIFALVVHFVPILTARGIAPIEAAGVASLIGVFSIIGRLGTGYLLDRLRGSIVGAAVFLLPIAGGLLLIGDGADLPRLAVAAALIGLTLGAEVDVITYLTSSYFGVRNFGTLYGGLFMALAAGAAAGQFAASSIFDNTGGYAPFLWTTIALMLLSSVCLASLPRAER